jgi:uncharacterized protein with PhoU and TrkA domain
VNVAFIKRLMISLFTDSSQFNKPSVKSAVNCLEENVNMLSVKTEKRSITAQKVIYDHRCRIFPVPLISCRHTVA